MEAIDALLPAGFTLGKTLVFGIVLALGLKAGEALFDMIAGAAANARQRKR